MAEQQAAPLSRPVRPVSFAWILDAKNDLIWYIGSALAGWLYVGLIFLAVWRLDDPLHGEFGRLRLGGLEIPLTLKLLVYSSWALLVDAPHVWSTLARTYFDPEERHLRRRELWLSWGWFFFGPALILAPYAVAWLLKPLGIDLPPGALPLGVILFYVFFRLWAYYHVVRQHWGFFMLYKRKNGDMAPGVNRVDTWCFNLLLYSPLVLFIAGPIYSKTPGMPPLGLEFLRWGNFSLPALLNGVAWITFLGSLLFWAGYQVYLWRSGTRLNGPKLLLMLAIIPLHFLAFNNPWLAAMLVPIVTVGHNLQYHRIVWMFGQNKYVKPEPKAGFAIARFLFSRAWIYLGVGLLFTFALYRGPWIEWLQATTGIALDRSVFAGVGMMAGLQDPLNLSLGQQLFGAMLIGWAMQHYYLDAKIWRVGRDKGVAKQLNV
jgi:hypothetical protein